MYLLFKSLNICLTPLSRKWFVSALRCFDNDPKIKNILLSHPVAAHFPPRWTAYYRASDPPRGQFGSITLFYQSDRFLSKSHTESDLKPIWRHHDESVYIILVIGGYLAVKMVPFIRVDNSRVLSSAQVGSGFLNFRIVGVINSLSLSTIPLDRP